MSAANVDQVTGTVRQLDTIRNAPTPMTEQTVTDAPSVVRLVGGILRDLSTLLGRWAPRRIDFENVISTGAAGAPYTVQLTHNFNSNVRWWLVDLTNRGATVAPVMDRILTSDLNVLTLRFYWPATFTVRVEASG